MAMCVVLSTRRSILQRGEKLKKYYVKCFNDSIHRCCNVQRTIRRWLNIFCLIVHKNPENCCRSRQNYASSLTKLWRICSVRWIWRRRSPDMCTVEPSISPLQLRLTWTWRLTIFLTVNKQTQPIEVGQFDEPGQHPWIPGWQRRLRKRKQRSLTL